MKTIAYLLLVVGSAQAAEDTASCGGYFVQLADGSRIDDCTPKVKGPVMPAVQPPPAAPPAITPPAPVELPAIDLHPARMTNADVIRMVQGRVFTASILAAIQDAQQPRFGVLPPEDAALLAAGVPEEVYRAMAARMEGPAYTPPAAAQKAFGWDWEEYPAQPAMSGWQKAAMILDFAGRFVPQRYSVTIRHKR